jgi:hypothetical protein
VVFSLEDEEFLNPDFHDMCYSWHLAWMDALYNKQLRIQVSYIKLVKCDHYNNYCSNAYLWSLWYIHLLRSNNNWKITSVINISACIYHIIMYAVYCPSTEEPSTRISFSAFYIFNTLIYVCLSYYIYH